MLATCVAACASPLSPNELRLLARGQQKWAARGFADYAIEMRFSCFCPPEITDWARVEVRAGQVSRVVLLPSGSVITDYRLGWWSTVETLFNTIRTANGSDYLDDVQFTLDATLGFPTLVQWIPDSGVLDAGGTQSLRNPTALP